MPDQRALPEAIRKRLNQGGLPFRDFVELALYDPQSGYYTAERG